MARFQQERTVRALCCGSLPARGTPAGAVKEGRGLAFCVLS